MPLGHAPKGGVREFRRHETHTNNQYAFYKGKEMTTTKYSVKASAILDELAACGITDVVTVPDYVQASVHMALEAGYLPGVKVVNCATEDEAVAIALGLWIGGRTPMLIMQNQGVFACANALRSVGMNARTPIFMLVGQWGRELENLGQDPSLSKRRVVRGIEPLLTALEIPWYRLESPADIGVIRQAFKQAFGTETPAAVLVGAHTAYS